MMRFLLACTIGCALQRYVSTDEQWVRANAEASRYLTSNLAKFEDILPVELLPGTCYTNRQLDCMSESTVKARYDHEVGALRPTDHYEGSSTENLLYGQRGVPIARTPDNRIEHVTAYLLDNGPRTTGRTTVYAAGMTLRTVVQNCTARGAHAEALARIMNAVESVGFTAMSRFCTLAVELLRGVPVQMDVFYEAFHQLFETMQTKFDRLYISTNPVNEMRTAVLVIQGHTLPRDETDIVMRRHVYFETFCGEFRSRYRFMFNYEIIDGLPGMVNEANVNTLAGQLLIIINNAHNFFISIGELTRL